MFQKALGSGDAAQERERAGLCEEVCKLWREHSRGTVYRAGVEGAGAEPEAVSRDVQGHSGAGDSGAAAQDFVELPCGVGIDTDEILRRLLAFMPPPKEG
jgi:hypothetical protein